MPKFDSKELTDYVTNDIDGRFWLEDRIEEVIRGARSSLAFADYDADQYEARDSQYNQGFDDGYRECQLDQDDD